MGIATNTPLDQMTLTNLVKLQQKLANELAERLAGREPKPEARHRQYETENEQKPDFDNAFSLRF